MASFLVKSAAQELGDLVVEEAKSLYKVRGKIESLQRQLEWMDCFLRDVDTQLQKGNVMSKLVSEVRDLAYEAEDIVEKYLHGVSHHRREGIRNTLKWFSCILCTGDAYTLRNLGSDIDSLRVKFSELNSWLQTYGITIIKPTETQSSIYNTMVKEERRTYSHAEEDEVLGLENHIKKLVCQLVNTDVKVVGISGVGGLGKSTLAKKVFLDKDTRRHFEDNCVWVHISKQVERYSVFREILIGLYRNEDEKCKVKDMEIEELDRQMIYKLDGMIYELFQQRRCFVVLDDVRTVDAWRSLEPAFQSINNTGSKIMVTTRDQGLLQHIVSTGYTGYHHRLEPLSAEDSWKLLQLKAIRPKKSTENEEETSTQDTNVNFAAEENLTIKYLNTPVESSSRRQNEIGQDKPQVDNDLKLKEKMGKEMLKHCGGLPLAITALGGILLGRRTVSQWEDVQKNISSYLMINIGDGNDNGGILQLLELSYHDLPFYLKPCFLYLGHFPEDYEIRTRKLYRLWEAEGILAIPSNDDVEVEGVPSFEIGERCLHELIDRSMVQVGTCSSTGRIKACRVNDVMRDMCLRKCKEVCFLNVWTDIPDGSISNKKVQGPMPTKKIRHCAFHGKSLDSLNSLVSAQHGGEAPYLRSLFISNDSMSDSRDLDSILKPFPMLRVLDVQKAFIIGNLGPVGHLIHLRYLGVRGVGNFTLSPSIWDLKNLICLDLRCPYYCAPKLPNKFHKMQRLRHLYLPRNYKIEKGKKLSFSAQSHQMETLKNFDPSKCQMEGLQKMKCLRIFSITNFYYFNSKDVFRAFSDCLMIKSGHLTNSLEIRMEAGVMNEDTTILTSLGDNQYFTKLFLDGDYSEQYDNIDSAIKSGVEVFPSSLKSVTLQGIRLSKEISSKLGMLPHLEHLKVLNLRTASYEMSFVVGSFEHLRTLELFGIRNLEEWEVGDGTLSNLRFLSMSRCQNLKKIPDGLPDSVHIECYDPCINGIEKYNTCPDFNAKTQETDDGQLSTYVS